MSEPIFEFRGVSKVYTVRAAILGGGQKFYALKNLDLKLERGEFYGIVGESGSGKTTIARLMAGLTQASAGAVLFEGKDLLDWEKGRPAFAHKVQLIFQNPYLSLNPRWTVREIVSEGIRSQPRGEREAAVKGALEKVQLKLEFLDRRAFQLSGGERQRVAIARALVTEPEFLILDEPTSQLDVSVQAQFIKLLISLRTAFKGGMVFITHDLALVRLLVSQVIVLSKGEIVESGTTGRVLSRPEHSYTRSLIRSVIPWPPS